MSIENNIFKFRREATEEKTLKIYNYSKGISFFNFNGLKNKMQNEKRKSYIINLKYKINTDAKNLKILGEKFIEKNKKIFKVIINNKEFKPIFSILLDDKDKARKTKNIKLKQFDNWLSIESMFYGCASLISISDILHLNYNTIQSMSRIFYGCSFLIHLPDISIWNTSKVRDISGVFFKCSSLTELPDISKWDTNNVINIECLFFKCSSLKKLPDISLWKSNSLTEMSCLFYDCSSLMEIDSFRFAHL